MRHTLQIRFFKWLVIQTVCIFLAVGTVRLIYRIHEQKKHPDLAEERAEAYVTVSILVFSLVPLSLFMAWSVSKQMRRLLQPIFDTADQVRSGNLERRILPVEPNDEIGSLSTKLNEAFDRYRDALSRLERFSFDASHQLRNPLAAIRASGEICLQRERSAEEYRQTIGMMLEDADRLSATVEQLLTLARLAYKDLAAEIEVFTVRELVESAVEHFKEPCELKEIEFRTVISNADVRVRGVRYLLQEALTNLLDNAVRFTPQKGRIQVSLEDAPAGCFKLVIDDSGPGVSEDQQKMAGVPGIEGVDIRSRQGTGLGLLIVADIVTLHKGSINVTRSPWDGARFEIVLSRAQ